MKGNNIRLLLVGLVVIIVLAVVVMRGDQLVELVDTMKQGSLLPLVAAVCTQLGKYVSQSFAYSHCFKAVHETMRPRSTLPLVFGTFFMNTIAPSLNLAGTTLVVNDARKRGIEAGKATSAALLMQITIDGAFATIMILAFAMLALTVGLSPLWFLLGLLVVILVGGMICIMVLGRKRPSAVLRVLSPIERLVNRIVVRFKRKPLKPWAERTVGSFSDAAGLIGHNPRPALEAFGCSIIASLCELSCFCLVGVAFGVTSIEPLVCGYVVATLFAMISITPQGVGVVEAMVVVAFTAFGESSAAGMAIGLVYRGIVFWMPFIIGAILINVTKTFRGEEKAGKAEKPGVGAPEAETFGSSHWRLQQTDRPSKTLLTETIEAKDPGEVRAGGRPAPVPKEEGSAAAARDAGNERREGIGRSPVARFDKKERIADDDLA